MSAHFTTPTDELLLLAETLGEVKTKADKLEAEFSTQARPLEAATNALSAALSGIKALQFHVLDNNLGALSARVEEMRKAVDEQVGVIALELKKADETNAAKAGAEAETLRSEIVALQSQLGSLVTQFGQQLERVEFAAKEEAKKLQLIPGPAGAAGASLNPRGTFIDGETYNRLDVVSWLGSSYIAAVDGVTEKPSRNSNQWQVLASRGGGSAGGAADFGSLAGVAQINQGGTGQTTRAAGLNALLPDQTGATQYMLLTDGAGNVSWGAQPVAGLPSQTSNSGKLLTTNGTSASWSNAVTVSGSNATVTGTLTVNGTTASVGAGTGSIISKLNGAAGSYKLSIYQSAGVDRWYAGLAAGAESGSDGGAPYSIVALTDAGAVIDNALLITRAAGGSITTPRPVSISATTASTTTSTGALVVGNGTSGGLGVGGAIFCGSLNATADSKISSAAAKTSSADTLKIATATGGSSDFELLISRSAAGSGAYYSIQSVEQATGYRGLVLQKDGGNVLIGGTTDISGNGGLKVFGTTASDATSSGSLIVAGGAGVAGAVNVGTFYGMVDGVTAPGTTSGYAKIYVDSADGDLKVKFGDGTVKTIATDS
jgi:hypothetical protein